MQAYFELKSFEEIDTRLLYEMGRLRQEVFVVEQECWYLDFDGRDYEAHHLFAYEQGDATRRLIGYCRLLPPGMNYENAACIGRVVNRLDLRGRGLGQQITKEALRQIRQLYPEHEVRISAQSRLRKFYENLGFTATDIEYMEDNIPHTEMFYPLERALV